MIAASEDFTMPKEVRDRINNANSHRNNFTTYLVNGGHMDSPFDSRGREDIIGDFEKFKEQINAPDEPISFEELNTASKYGSSVYNATHSKILADGWHNNPPDQNNKEHNEVSIKDRRRKF